MTVKLLFLGRLADAAGAPQLEFPAPTSLGSICPTLPDQLVQMLQADKVKTALNGTVIAVEDDKILEDGDELAFLPPVSGG